MNAVLGILAYTGKSTPGFPWTPEAKEHFSNFPLPKIDRAKKLKAVCNKSNVKKSTMYLNQSVFSKQAMKDDTGGLITATTDFQI